MHLVPELLLIFELFVLSRKVYYRIILAVHDTISFSKYPLETVIKSYSSL